MKEKRRLRNFLLNVINQSIYRKFSQIKNLEILYLREYKYWDQKCYINKTKYKALKRNQLKTVNGFFQGRQ